MKEINTLKLKKVPSEHFQLFYWFLLTHNVVCVWEFRFSWRKKMLWIQNTRRIARDWIIIRAQIINILHSEKRYTCQNRREKENTLRTHTMKLNVEPRRNNNEKKWKHIMRIYSSSSNNNGTNYYSLYTYEKRMWTIKHRAHNPTRMYNRRERLFAKPIVAFLFRKKCSFSVNNAHIWYENSLF